MSFCLVQMSLHQMQELAAARVPSELAPLTEAGAFPPPFVCIRALAQLAAGGTPTWSNPFMVVREADGRIVGSCGFKDGPRNGRVEIGYGVAAGSRGSGAATAAVEALLELAFLGGAQEVLAEVEPGNLASSRVVQKAGFCKGAERIDEGNELVVQWIARRA